MSDKYCKKCDTTKPLLEFHKSKYQKDGHSFYCKSCNCARVSEWTTRNLEKNRSRARSWADDHRDANKSWQQNNKKACREKNKKWFDKNQDKRRSYDVKRKALKRNASGPHHTADDIKELKVIQKNRCSYCGTDISQKYHVDHIVPLSRGGSNKKDNIALTCPRCNLSKHDKLLWTEWMPLLASVFCNGDT